MASANLLGLWIIDNVTVRNQEVLAIGFYYISFVAYTFGVFWHRDVGAKLDSGGFASWRTLLRLSVA